MRQVNPEAAYRLAGAVLVCVSAVYASAAAAQPVVTASGPHVLERSVRDRWLHAGQHPDFTVFVETRTATHVRATAAPGPLPGRTLELVQQQLGARLTLDATNRPTSLMLDQPRLFVSYYEAAADRAETRRRRLIGAGATLSLPEARFWEVPFVLPQTPLARGVTWADTLEFVADGEGLRERLTGVWHNEVIGDTIIGGLRLPLVVTTAQLRYRARELTSDPALDHVFEVVRDVSGTMRGRAAIDTLVGVRAAGADSTLLMGTAALDLGAGRTVTSPVRYERARTWLLRDSAAWAVVQDSLRAEQRRQSRGMLGFPRTPLEERIAAGDASAEDSLWTAWRTTADPNERQLIARLLQLHDSRRTMTPSNAERLRALRLQLGDSAGVLAEMLTMTPRRYSADVLPYLADPARMWRLGVLPRYPYVELANQLLRATSLLEPDTTHWGCAPELCAAVIAQLEAADEVRLRDVALIGAFARDPARWWERVQARADAGSLLARRALRLGEGVGATWPAARNTPVPPAGADWRAWLTWLGGNATRWERTHADALRMFTARSGRDPVAELLQRWPPTDDSARLVIGTVLRGMNALGVPSSAELAGALRFGSEADRAAAADQLPRLLRAHGSPAPDSLRLALLQPLLEALAAGRGHPWPPLHADPRPRPAPPAAPAEPDTASFIALDELPPELAAALPPPLRPQQAAADRPLRVGGRFIRLAPVRVWGDFVSVGWTTTTYRRRAADEAPAGYASGTSLILLRTDDGWVVVSALFAVT